MSNQKIENLLNLALDATGEEREKSLELDVGYDRMERTWEVIVKYGGTTEQLQELLFKNFPEQYERIRFTNLQNEYAILLLPESIVEAVANLTEIEYMEKPKSLFFAVESGRRASCISPLQTAARLPGQEENKTAQQLVGNQTNDRTNLTGVGCIVAIIDSGERVIIMSS